MYMIKEKESYDVDIKDRNNIRYTNVLRYGFYYEKKKVGHVEVCVIDGHNYFAERLPKFIEEATKLFDRVVLGNTEIENEFVKKLP